MLEIAASKNTNNSREMRDSCTGDYCCCVFILYYNAYVHCALQLDSSNKSLCTEQPSAATGDRGPDPCHTQVLSIQNSWTIVDGSCSADALLYYNKTEITWLPELLGLWRGFLGRSIYDTSGSIFSILQFLYSHVMHLVR